MTGHWPGPPPQGPPPQVPALQGPQAPEPVERPDDIKFSVIAWVITIVLSAVSNGVGFWRSAQDPAVRAELERTRSETFGNAANAPDMDSLQTLMMVVMYGLLAVAVAIGLLVVYLLWRGQRWTRMVLQIGAALVLAQGVLALFGVRDGWIAVPGILAAVAVIGAMITANSKDSIRYLNGPRR